MHCSRQVPRPIAKSAAQTAQALAAPVEGRVDGEGLSHWNGFGGFDGDGRHYVVRLAARRTTPQPWINVVSNESFGFHVSAEGAAFTWSRNSRDYQLTPWSNDPVTNRPGEGIYIYDHASGKAFSPLAAVARDPAMTYETWHGQGFSTFRSRRGSLSMDLTHVVDPVDPVKISRLRIQNSGSAAGTAAGLCLRGMGPWQPSVAHGGNHHSVQGCRDRRDAGAKSIRTRFQRACGLSGHRRRGAFGDG